MNEVGKVLGDALLDAIRLAIREEMQTVHQNGQQAGDRLLDVDEASKVLCVDEGWLYRHHKKLPFTLHLQIPP